MKFLRLLFFVATLSFAINGQAAPHTDCFDEVKSFLDDFSEVEAQKISGVGQAKSFSQLQKFYEEEDLFTIKSSLSLSKIRKHNKKLKSLLASSSIPASDDDLVTKINQTQASKLYTSMVTNPIVRDQFQYMNGNFGIGFCFGRAVVAHLEGLRRNVHPLAIKKIWAVGDMGQWGHHVGTIVRSEVDGEWFVIDNYTGLKKVNDWMVRMSSEARNGDEIMFFVTDASRFGPELERRYSPVDLFGSGDNDFYNGFFKDLFAHYADQELPQSF